MSENNDGVIFTPKTEEEGKINEFPEIKNEQEDSPILSQEEIEKFAPQPEENEGAVEGAATDTTPKKYIKISPTFHIMPVSGETEHEIFKIFNPQTNVTEERELNDIEKHEILVKEFKESRIRFRNVTHDGNVTKVKFGSNYHKERKRKNRIQKKSRVINR